PLAVFDQCGYDDAVDMLSAKLQKLYKDHGKDWTDDMRNFAEKTVTLDCIDRRWTKHIDQMSKLRDAIWLRSYAQTDPLQAYTNEGFGMFETMNAMISQDVVRTLLHVAFRANPKANAENVAKAPINQIPTANNIPDTAKVKYNGTQMESNVKPDDDGIDRSNPTAKIS
ncbi:MAG: hypothetical protein WCS80_05700, partial [Bacilli bacterium]